MVVLAASACSSDPGGGSGGEGGGGSEAASTATAASTSGAGGGSGGAGGGGVGGAGSSNDCPKTLNHGEATTLTVTSLEATVVDLEGKPAAQIPAQLCGTDICLKGETDEAGHVLVSGGGKTLARPAFKYGDGLLYGRFAVPLSEGKSSFPSAVTPRLPEPGAPLEAGKEATSGGVTLVLASGTEVDIDTLTYTSPEEEAFRAALIPLEKAPPAVDPSLGLEILYAAAPVETFFCPAAELVVPNTPGWPADTEVEVFVHGVDTSERFVPYGGWAKVSDGRVSADGATVATSPGGGLPVLSAFGIRKKQ